LKPIFSSFLIIRLSSLGDILLMTPALRALRRDFPESRIDVLTRSRYQELLDGNPNLSNLILFDSADEAREMKRIQADLKGRYDVVVDLHTGLRSFRIRRNLRAKRVLVYHKHRLARQILVATKINRLGDDFSVPLAYLQALEPLGVRDDGLGLEWPGAMVRRDQFLAFTGMEAAPDNKPIALCPGASYGTKRWPLKKWVDLAEILLERGHSLWIFGDGQDAQAGAALKAKDPSRVSNFCGTLRPALSGAGLSFCRAAVTNDAGPMHMAAAVGTPVVAIFGSTVPEFGFRPFRVPHRISQVAVWCRPCSHLGFAKCPLGHFKCMKQQKAEGVAKLVEELKSYEL
jgi:heptosyltransferase-2